MIIISSWADGWKKNKAKSIVIACVACGCDWFYFNFFFKTGTLEYRSSNELIIPSIHLLLFCKALMLSAAEENWMHRMTEDTLEIFA